MSVIDRLPPSDLDAERAALGCCLLSEAALDDVHSILRTDDFYSHAHQEIFRLSKAMQLEGRPVDSVTIAERLFATEKLEEIGGPAYIGQLLEGVPHAAHAEYYAEIVLNLSRRRKLIETATAAIQGAYGSAETSDIVADAEAGLHAILERDAGGQTVSINDALAEVFARLDRKETPGIPMGWSGIDELYEMQRGNLIIVAARPSMGKTGFAGNLLLNTANKGRKSLIFSIEQSRDEITERLLSSYTKISGLKISGKEYLEEHERLALLEASSGLSQLPIGIDDDPSVTVSKISAKSRLWKRKHGLDLVVVDYLQLIESEDRKAPREQQVAEISRTLKKLAKQLDIPLVCLAQLNRELEKRPDKRPKLSDLRESGAIEQDASVVMLLHRPEYFNAMDRPGEADVIIAKNRNGKTGTVPLQYDESTITFRDLAPRYVNEWANDEF